MNSALDVSILKEIAKKDIVALLNKFPGPKVFRLKSEIIIRMESLVQIFSFDPDSGLGQRSHQSSELGVGSFAF